MGRRVKKAVYAHGSDGWELEKEILFVYDGWNLIQEIEVSAAGDPLFDKFYVWGPDLFQSIQGAGGIGGLVCRVSGGEVRHYFYDANGNVGQLVNPADGAVTARYEYDPFGKAIVADGIDAAGNVFRFSTKYWDEETDLVYYGYRYYSADFGRWVNMDPSKENGGFNLYAVVYNNPIDSIDLLGMYTLVESWEEAYSKINPGSRTIIWQRQFNRWLRRMSNEEKFLIWYKLEKTREPWWLNLPRCPRELCMENGKPKNPNINIWKNPQKPREQEVDLHPGTDWSLRSIPDAENHANQCTYKIVDGKAILLTEPPGAGTVDWHKSGSFAHYYHDVEPIYLANIADGGEKMSLYPFSPSILAKPGKNILKYYEVRPFHAEPVKVK